MSPQNPPENTSPEIIPHLRPSDPTPFWRLAFKGQSGLGHHGLEGLQQQKSEKKKNMLAFFISLGIYI